MWSTSIAEARQGRGEDRIATVERPDRVITIVADGAGGTSGGSAAAEMLCSELTSRTDNTPWDVWLEAVDRKMATSSTYGLAAAVVVEVRNDSTVIGASVGDCEAWIFTGGASVALTDHQCRKPFLGSGETVPTSFAAHLFAGDTLVVGSDGLWKYTTQSRICEAAAIRPLDLATAKLVDTVRLKSGSLQDDVAVFIYSLGEK